MAASENLEVARLQFQYDIYALEKPKAKEALPQLRALLDDNERIHFDGLGTVAEAARVAIAKLEEMP